MLILILFIILIYQYYSNLNILMRKQQQSQLFEETEYVSDDEEDVRTGYKSAINSNNNPRALAPSESNMTLSMKQGEQLIKLMKDRGIEISESELSKMKPKQIEITKSKSNKPGFYDGGHSATVPELLSALNKAYSNNDPQQASCILSYLLDNKTLNAQDRSKFGLMKCNLLFNLAAYEECCAKASQIIEKPFSDLQSATLSNYLAKCKAELDRVWQGYMDLHRAKALIVEFKAQKQRQIENHKKNEDSEFIDTQFDSLLRDINHTELQYNIKLSKQKNYINFVYPIFPVFRNRKVTQLACGDYHAIFLTSGPIQYNKNIEESNGRWNSQIFGIGQNAAGQVLGKIFQNKINFSEPILIKQLSGKGISGIFATRQSSIAYDSIGNIYQWGANKQSGNKNVQLTTKITQNIKKLQKGNKHYAVLTNDGKFFIWGKIQFCETIIFNQANPIQTKILDVSDFSCGYNSIMAIDKLNTLWSMGSNQYGQLCVEGEKFLKEMVKVRTDKYGIIKKVFAIGDATFLLTNDQEVFFCGKYSHNKEAAFKLKQAQFPDEPNIISISGNPGLYFVTDVNGNTYRWEVDNSVKFKLMKYQEKISQRMIDCCKGTQYRLNTLPKQEYSTLKLMSTNLKTYEGIIFELGLFDAYGAYGNDLLQPLKINIVISKKKAKREDLIQQSQKFIKLTNNKYVANIIYVDEIIQSNLLSAKYLQSKQQAPKYSKQIQIMVEKAGSYYFYMLINSILIDGSPILLNINPSEKESEFQKKMLEEKERKKLQKQRQRQREEEQKRLRQQQRLAELEKIQKRKETQKKAQQTLKKHMRQQEQQRKRQQQERRRKNELMTGGGFDLNKLKKKTSNEDYTGYTTEGLQLPDINVRPSSKKKLVLKKNEGSGIIVPPTNPSIIIQKQTELKTSVGFRRPDSRSKK